VEKIVGPGNIYVTLAKREVFGLVGIDMLAGPSELAVIADAEADPDYLALEILAQIEHGSGARACLVSCDEGLMGKVDTGLSRLAETRKENAANVAAVLVGDLDEAVRMVDILAPEHLIIATSEVTGVVDKVHNAGAVFLGAESPVALGDYAIGVNHVLPTKGASRFSSPLGVYDFVKKSNIVFSNPKANRALGPVVETLARVEGLTNHAEAMRKHMH
jgi:histidinol dehydrogenase